MLFILSSRRIKKILEDLRSIQQFPRTAPHLLKIGRNSFWLFAPRKYLVWWWEVEAIGKLFIQSWYPTNQSPNQSLPPQPNLFCEKDWLWLGVYPIRRLISLPLSLSIIEYSVAWELINLYEIIGCMLQSFWNYMIVSNRIRWVIYCFRDVFSFLFLISFVE